LVDDDDDDDDDDNNNNNNNNKRSALGIKCKINYSYNGSRAPSHTTSADYSYPHKYLMQSTRDVSGLVDISVYRVTACWTAGKDSS